MRLARQRGHIKALGLRAPILASEDLPTIATGTAPAATLVIARRSRAVACA
jgi:hypothetical protein